MCGNIFEKNESIDDIGLTIRLIDAVFNVTITYEGMLYDPFSNEALMESENIKKVSELCKFEYDTILGFNRVYLIFGDGKTQS